MFTAELLHDTSSKNSGGASKQFGRFQEPGLVSKKFPIDTKNSLLLLTTKPNKIQKSV